jgi:xylulokinase
MILGTTDYINYLLTGELVTGRSNACGSGAYDLMDEDFSDEILEGNGLNRKLFPPIKLETDVIGRILPDAADALGLSTDTLVTVGGTDNICMAVGAKCFASGRAYIALGSSCWIALTGDKPVLDINSYPYIFPLCGDLFNSALSLASGGSSYKWVKEQLCGDLDIAARELGKNVYKLMEELVSSSPVGANGLLFNCCLGGGMPIDPGPNMRGGYLGLQLKHTKADVLRATLEGITFKLRECKESLENVAKIDDEILLVGGGSKTGIWRQIIADCFNKTVLKSNIDNQAAALGAAAFAAVGTGMWSDYNLIDELHKIECRIVPNHENTKIYDKLFALHLDGNKYLSSLGDGLNALAPRR